MFFLCPLIVYFCPFYDTVGESFELNVAAAQEAGTLIKTAKPIILAQGSVREKWNYSYICTTHAGSISQLAQLQFASNDSPTVSDNVLTRVRRAAPAGRGGRHRPAPCVMNWLMASAHGQRSGSGRTVRPASIAWSEAGSGGDAGGMISRSLSQTYRRVLPSAKLRS
jgi:hypothetical protein